MSQKVVVNRRVGGFSLSRKCVAHMIENGYKLSDLQHDPSILGRTYKKCLGSQIQPCVGADGEVYVCCNHRGYKEYSYGNLNEKSFKDIWNDIE